MRKRRKKKIAVAIDDIGRYLNCYGKLILWTKADLRKSKQKARKFAKVLGFN